MCISLCAPCLRGESGASDKILVVWGGGVWYYRGINFMAFAGYITELLPKDEGMVFRLKNSGQKIFLFCLILLAGSCQATPDGAMKNFNTLPLDNNTLVAMNLRENLGNECHSIIVTALFYNPEPFENVLNDIEIALVNEGWQEDDWYYRKTKNGMLPPAALEDV